MIKAVIFDLDDTLISEREYIKSGFHEVASKIANDYDLSAKQVYEFLYAEFKVDTKNVFNRVLERLNLSYKMEYIKGLIDTYRGHMPNIKLYDDAKYIIEVLHNKGIKLGIITDGYKIAQRNKLKVLDIDRYFEYIVVTDELGREYWKPHQKSYEIIKEKLGLDFKEMVYVGDNVSKDFVTANKLEMRTVLIRREKGIYSTIQKEEEYNAKLEVMSLVEMEKIIK